ncbi:MAG: adenylate/guanylate cyclase domain-containing protein [Candidatus Anammoxibacter sp.]
MNVHLPFKEDDFIDASVRFAGEKWVTRFKKALKKASSVIEPVDEAYLGDQCLFDYGNRMIIGKTLLHAETLSLTPHLLAVWDGKPGDGRGGTADTIKSWKKWGGKNITIVDISKLSPPKEKSVSTARSVKPFAEISPKKNFGSLSREIKSMLFADVVGFSKLQDDQIPYYIYQFMGAVGKLVTGGKYIPVFNNTWGDGLFFVFNSVCDAACFALELRDLVLKTDWKKKGLPPETNIRIALHSGPVYSGFDPLLGKLNYYGAHVSRSARLEPITMPGSVYASDSFAALLKVDGVTDPVCEYLGKLPLAKDYGVYSVYHIRRRNEIE